MRGEYRRWVEGGRLCRAAVCKRRGAVLLNSSAKPNGASNRQTNNGERWVGIRVGELGEEGVARASACVVTIPRSPKWHKWQAPRPNKPAG